MVPILLQILSGAQSAADLNSTTWLFLMRTHLTLRYSGLDVAACMVA
jgi:hypothetical protein